MRLSEAIELVLDEAETSALDCQPRFLQHPTHTQAIGLFDI